jgi:23S rRNA pseudouridine2605 synthase
MTMRLQRALARAGVASRRGAEGLIEAGEVTVNGVVAQVGQSVDPAKDVIAVGGKRIKRASNVSIALNKPVGYVVSKADEKKRETVFDLIPDFPGITYVGRLDILTGGLLILTSDGELANRLTHPRYGVEKEYQAYVRGANVREIQHMLSEGIVVEGKEVALKRFTVETAGKGTVKLTLVLTEGRNRIVRKMCGEMELEVVTLERVSHGPIKLEGLKPGKWRNLRPDEMKRLQALKK